MRAPDLNVPDAELVRLRGRLTDVLADVRSTLGIGQLEALDWTAERLENALAIERMRYVGELATELRRDSA